MFVKDKTKISSGVGGAKWRVMYFGKLVFESDEQELGLRGAKSKKISSHRKRSVEERSEGEKCLGQSWSSGWKLRKEELSVIRVYKGGGQLKGKGKDQSSASVHIE